MDDDDGVEPASSLSNRKNARNMLIPKSTTLIHLAGFGPRARYTVQVYECKKAVLLSSNTDPISV